MLGPSGSGKTTCLRLIAGFEQPTGGHIEIFGETADGVPPYRRNVNTVFQDYALFPHLTILDNVAYGLMVKGVDKAERRRKAAEDALDLVKLPGYGSRRPGQLSGGQRQRVALARALVNKPKVLLLDEPLGALDLKLREQMQEELKTLQKALGITFVFVTHDQGEALSMADRVAVFNDGKIVSRLGTPEDIYKRPQTRFVADFVGSSNVICAATPCARLGGDRPLGKPAPRSHPPSARRRGPAEPVRHRRCPQFPRRRQPASASIATARRSSLQAPAVAARARNRRNRDAVASSAGRRALRWRRHDADRPRHPSFRKRPGLLGRLSDLSLAATRTLLLATLLGPPLLWLGIIYVGSLLALLLQSFFSIDDFSGLINYEFTLRDLPPASVGRQFRHHRPHRDDGGGGDHRLGGHRLPHRLLCGALCQGKMEGNLLSRRHAAALVELSRQDLCLEADPRQGRHPHLGLRQAASAPGCSMPCWRCRSSVAIRCRSAILGTFLVFVYVWLPYMILPTQAALERVPGNLIEASGDLGATPAQTFRTRAVAAGPARHRRRLDLHLLADARRLHHPADHRLVAPVHRPGRLCPAGHGRQHSARRRLHGRADRHHGRLSLGRQTMGAFDAL